METKNMEKTGQPIVLIRQDLLPENQKPLETNNDQNIVKQENENE